MFIDLKMQLISILHTEKGWYLLIVVRWFFLQFSIFNIPITFINDILTPCAFVYILSFLHPSILVFVLVYVMHSEPSLTFSQSFSPQWFYSVLWSDSLQVPHPNSHVLTLWTISLLLSSFLMKSYWTRQHFGISC